MDNRDRWAALLRSCNRSLLSFQLYASHQYSEGGGGAQEVESLVLREVPAVIRDRVETYARRSVLPQGSLPWEQVFLEKDVLKTISGCFQVDLEEAGRIFRGFSYLREGGFILRFTNTDDRFLSREEAPGSGRRPASEGGGSEPSSGGGLDCFFSDADLMSRIYDFVLQEQLSLLDSVKFMYENATFEKEGSGFGPLLRRVCFGEVLWGRDHLDHPAREREADGRPGSAFNLLDELWRWYRRLVDDEFADFASPEMERIFGGPLQQTHSRLLLESSLLHTLLVVLQAQNTYLAGREPAQRRPEAEAEAEDSLSRSSPLDRCRLILSELQARCFLGSLYTLYSSRSGVGIAPLTLCDAGLAHSTSMVDQLRQTASNGVLLASSSVLALSPKDLTLRNEDLGFLIDVVATLLESLCSSDSGELLRGAREEAHSFSTPARARTAQLTGGVHRQLFVRGNLLLVHAKVVKPLLPALIFSYASVVAQTPNRDSLLAPVLLDAPAFFRSSAFPDSLESLLRALSSQHPPRQCVSASLLPAPPGPPRDRSVQLDESFGGYYQHLALYSIIRSAVSTFSLGALPSVARISKHLGSLLRREPRLVFRECWRGDYFRQIGVHLILELFLGCFPYGIVEFLDLLSSLVPDFASLPRLSQADAEMAKQSFKLFMTFLRTPISSVSFPPYLPSLGLAPIPVSRWSPDSVRSESDPPELPLHLEVSRLETPPDLALGASFFSQASLSGTLEGCLLDLLEIRLGDVTPLSAGFPAARKCLTPLRVLPVGVAQPVPLRSLLLDNAETSFSSPLWANSPYGASFDLPEAEMPPYYHIHGSRARPDEQEASPPLDLSRLRLPCELGGSSAEVKLGELDPFAIRFCCKDAKNPRSLPSLLKALLLLWESIGLSLSQTGASPARPHLEMLVSLSELVYRLASFHKSVLLALDQEIFAWNALVPSAAAAASSSSHKGPRPPSRFGLLPIKTLQMLKGIRCLLDSRTNAEEAASVALHVLPRLVGLLRISLLPLDLLSLDDATNGNFLKLQPGSAELPDGDSDGALPPWSHKPSEVPMYWLVPLLVACAGSGGRQQQDWGSQRDCGLYSPLLKGVQGFGLEELFGLASKCLEVVEKQLKSYPVTAQVLEFTASLLGFCPAAFWGLGWDRHARLLLATLAEYSYGSAAANKVIRDLHLLVEDCLLCQRSAEETDQQRDHQSSFFGRVSHFSIHTVLSRIPSWPLSAESERNLLLLRSLSVFGLLLGSLDSATLVRSDEDHERLGAGTGRPEARDAAVNGLKEVVPGISGVASSNHRATVATLLKHVTETGLIPSLLALLSCEYSIHSQSFRRSRYSQVAKDELNDIPAPWELLVSNSAVARAMERSGSLSCILALRLQHSSSQLVFLDRLLAPPHRCGSALPDRSGELFSSPDVIVAQQVVAKVLKVVQKLLNSVADLRTNSELLCSLRTALAQWILSSSPSQGPHHAQNALLDSPKLGWSDSDAVAQHIHSRVSLLYLSKKPVMNLVKSLFSLMLSFVPSSMPPDAPIVATKLLSSFCHIFSLEAAGGSLQSQSQGSKSDVILEQILKPSVSLDSIQQDFLLSLTNTRLFPLLIKLLHQELDFVLLAPVFSFLKTFDFLGPETRSRDKTPVEISRALLELVNLFAASHPSTLVGPTGSLSLERLDHVLAHCRSNLTVRSGSPAQGSSPPSSVSRIGLICHAIVGVLEKADLVLQSVGSRTRPADSPDLLDILNLVPLSLSLLNQLFENTRSRDFLIREMLRHAKDDVATSPAAASIWSVIISVTRNLTSVWNRLRPEGASLSQAELQLLTTISSSLACAYHLTSRFISITTHLSFKNYNRLPVFLRERRIFDFVKFLVSDRAVCEILHSPSSSGVVSDLFLKSSARLSKIQDELGIPVRFCLFSQKTDSVVSGHYRGGGDDDHYCSSQQQLQHPENSLEQFVNKYYYERYLKFSHLVISNESVHSLTEFDLAKISEYRDESSKDPGSSCFDPTSQALKLPPSSSSETSQLATLEMVWESGQLLAPKQHFSASSPSLEKKDQTPGRGGGDPFLKHSVVSSRIKERPEAAKSLPPPARKDGPGSGRTPESPSLLSLRNSSFVHKTRQWGPDFELDVSAMLLLLSCCTAASISVPHAEMDTRALIAFSRESVLQVRRENSSRSFLESFMYLLSGYNELIFYLKTLLPVVIAKFSNLVADSFLSELAVLFDSAKLSLVGHCIHLSQKEDRLPGPDAADGSPGATPSLEEAERGYLPCPARRRNPSLPNLMMTILFSTCTDLLTFDLVSSVRLILGRAEMIETQNSLKSPSGPSCGEKGESCSLNLLPIAPNSSSVCLSSSWQDCGGGGPRGTTGPAFKGFVGNVISYMPVSDFSEQSQKPNVRRLFSALIEQCCRYIARNLRAVLAQEERPLASQTRDGAAAGCGRSSDFKHVWTIHSLQNGLPGQSRASPESDICLSCDLTAALYLLLFVLKQLPFLSEAEGCGAVPILESSAAASLLDLTSSCTRFYRKNGKLIHRIANEARSTTGPSGSLLGFLSSSLIALPILCLCIPAQILEVIYLDGRKKLLQDISSEFTMSACSLKTPIITKIKESLAAVPLLEEFNLDMAAKVVPALDSVIQLSLACIDKNEAPSFSYQQVLTRKGRPADSIGFLKPLRVPFLSWSEAAYQSMLASALSCLAALSSTSQGCVRILKSGILVQVASNFFLSGLDLPSGSSAAVPRPPHGRLDKSPQMPSSAAPPNPSFWPCTYLSVELGDQTIRNPMHILWCRLISVATNVFASVARTQSATHNNEDENRVRNAPRPVGSSSRRLGDRKTEEAGAHRPEQPLRDDSQAKEGVLKFVQIVEPRVQLILSEQRQISQLATLEEFSLGIDLIRAAIALNIPELRPQLTETLRKSLRTVRGVSVVSLGRGITEALDLFKPTSRIERISAGHSPETLNLYHLDSLPAQVPSIFHQRCCILLLNSVRSIIDTFVSESGFSLELRGCRELLMQLFHDTMDLGRPILQLLEDIPNHCYSVLTIVKSKDGESFLPLSLNVQALNPWEPSVADLPPEYKNASLNKNNVEFRGVARISAITESCCLPEMITLSSFVHLLSSLVDIIAICGAKCLYTLEGLEASDQHNDIIRRLLEFLHLSQGLNSSSLLDSSRGLIEKVYANLKSKLGDQINVEVVGLVGIKKDPIHALLFDRLSNTNSGVNSGI